MIGEVLIFAVLASPPEEPRPGDCIPDAAGLAAEADALIAQGSLARARERLRAARRLEPSVELTLKAADLAFAAGDAEEGVDLLGAAAETSPSRLSPAELYLVARRAEERRRWREAIARYAALARALDERGENSALIQAHLGPLVLEAEAAAVAAPSAAPPVEAQLALAEARRALSAGKLSAAREKLSVALQLAPSYVEALEALGAVETRAGRAPAAIRAYRGALSADPARVESLTALANLLWAEPDRAAKEQSLSLLDRAVALRPDLKPLLRLSAERRADFGDAPGALARLDRFLETATPRERDETRALREALARRARPATETPRPAPSAEPVPEEPASAAVAPWRKAQVLAARGDPESLNAALALLSEAETLDPAFAPAPELAAAIHEKRGEWAQAIAALERATGADASRASAWESLARALERDPRRAAAAENAWRRAAETGSTEALFQLGEALERQGRRPEALEFYRRYRDEAPAGSRAAEADAALARLEAERRSRVRTLAAVLLAAAAAGAFVLYRRMGGSTFAQWLAAHPGRAPEARPILGRLRHEALKHGGLLLSDGADRLEGGDASQRAEAARLLSARLYGRDGSAGLIAETEAAVAELQALARQDGTRLNLRHRDPVFSWLLAGLADLRRARGPLSRAAEIDSPDRPIRLASRLLRRAARAFVLASGAEMSRTLDRIAALPVRADALRALLARVADEIGVARPELETIGGVGVESPLPPVRMPAEDWETLWRNLFSNALAPKDEPPGRPVRLGLSAQTRRDPVTGEPRLRVVLADDLPGVLSAERLRAQALDRGWGIIGELLRKNGGAFEITPAPRGGFTKAIVLDLPALEEPV